MMKERIYPLGITQIDKEAVCVAGINEIGEWIRPEQLVLRDLYSSEGPLFRYGSCTEFHCTPSKAREKRIEDRDLDRSTHPVRIVHTLTPTQWRQFIIHHQDRDVHSILASNRTVGLVQAKVTSIVHGKSLSNRFNILITFTDNSHASHQVIAVDRKFISRYMKEVNIERSVTAQEESAIIRRMFPQDHTYFTVSLTRKDPDQSGRYNGCHLIIGGVHTFQTNSCPSDHEATDKNGFWP